MTDPKVAIVIINWNGLKDTAACIASLSFIKYENYSIIVVDNGSLANEANILLEMFPATITVIRNDVNLGFAGGANTGIKFALKDDDVEYILLLDNDTIVDEEFLSELVKVLENNQDVDIATSASYLYGSNELQRIGNKIGNIWTETILPIWIVLKKKVCESEDRVIDVTHVAFWSTLFRKNVFDRVGLLDEDLFWGWEDIDFCLRAMKTNTKIARVPFSKIWHKASASYRIDGSLQYYSTRNKFAIVRRYYPTQYLLMCLYMIVIHTPLAAFYHIVLHKNRCVFFHYLHGLVDGLFGKYGMRKVLL